MKKQTGNNIRLGMLVSVCLALLITGIYLIGDRQHMFSRTFRISCMFRDVNGLQGGNNVRFSGINVGIVEEIRIITDTAVKVDMIIEEHVRKFIKKDATALIGSEGLMGNKILVITPGTGLAGQIQDNDFIRSSPPITMEDIMAQLHVSTQNVTRITGDMSEIMKNIRSGKGAVGKLFMDTLLAKNLDQSIVNIREGSSGFKTNMDAAKNSFLLRGIFNRKDKNKEKATEKEEKSISRRNKR